MTPFEVATLTTSVALALGHIGIVWYDIRGMTWLTNMRADEITRLGKQQDQRYAEAPASLDMQPKALETLNARAGQAQPAA